MRTGPMVTISGAKARWFAVFLVGVVLLGACDDAGTPAVVDRTDATDVTLPDSEGPGDVAPSDVAAETTPETIGDGGPGDVDAPPPTGTIATGWLYRDPRGLSQSGWIQRPQADAEGIAGVEVTLLGPDGSRRTARTDAGGRVAFGELDAGRHLMLISGAPENTCTSNNMPRRFTDAVLEGDLTVVSFGDSVPHWGPTPWFPARLEATLDGFVDTEDVNIAVPGSTSEDWLPGGQHFGALMREVADADLAVFSLGGNDVTFYLSDFVEVDPSELLENIDYYLGLLDAKIAEIAENLQAIVASVRAANPDIDIVWFIYPNYAWNDYWAPYLGDWAPFVRPLLDERLDTIRSLMSRSDILLADMHAAIPGPEVAGLMVDELHLNAAGHTRYAEELFLLLGGITVGADSGSHRGLERRYGFQ